jgi:hypothetical protein
VTTRRPSIPCQDTDGPALTSCSLQENYHFSSLLPRLPVCSCSPRTHVPFFFADGRGRLREWDYPTSLGSLTLSGPILAFEYSRRYRPQLGRESSIHSPPKRHRRSSDAGPTRLPFFNRQLGRESASKSSPPQRPRMMPDRLLGRISQEQS